MTLNPSRPREGFKPMATLHHLPVTIPEPRRAVRDQETQAAYLSRTGEPASAKTTALALAHYEGELALDRAVGEIYEAGYADGLAAGAARPHLRLADVTAASVTALREASR